METKMIDLSIFLNVLEKQYLQGLLIIAEFK